MVKGVIFNFSGVVAEEHTRQFLRDTLPSGPADTGAAEDLSGQLEKTVQDYKEGKLSSDAFYAEFRRIGNLRITRETFRQAYTRRYRFVSQVADLVRKLKRSYRLALVANGGEWDRDDVIRRSAVYPLMDLLVLSCEIGIRLPRQRVFFILLDRLRMKPPDCIYVDRDPQCLRAASLLGLRTLNLKTTDRVGHQLLNEFSIHAG